MKGDCGRCLEIRFAERPGHGMKWPWLMAVINVDFTGLKAAVWKYLASLSLVLS